MVDNQNQQTKTNRDNENVVQNTNHQPSEKKKKEPYTEVAVETKEGKKTVKVASLKTLKTQKTESDKYKLQFLETLIYNYYDLDITCLALGYDILTIHNWIMLDAKFRKMLRQCVAAFKNIIKINMCHQTHKAGYKVRDCLALIQILPDFQEAMEQHEDAYIAMIPIVKSKDFEALANGELPEDKILGKIMMPFEGNQTIVAP